MGTFDLNIRLWLEKNKILERIYKNLSPHNKDTLHKLISQPPVLTTARERRDLYQALCSPTGIAGRKSIHPIADMTDEGIEDFFSPLTSGDWHDYLSKF